MPFVFYHVDAFFALPKIPSSNPGPFNYGPLLIFSLRERYASEQRVRYTVGDI
jgi:hypothetical protein